MHLEKEFKFTWEGHRSSSELFTAKLRQNKYNISWMIDDAKEESWYDVVDVLAYIEEGSWVTVSEVEEIIVGKDANASKQPIKSDGGSSSYYDMELPDWLIDLIFARREESGKAFIKTEECIEVFFGNDFDYGNQFKSQVRSYGTEQGGGKKFNNVSYEQSKIKYSADKIIELSERRKIK